MKRYVYDATLLAAFSVHALSRAEAASKLRATIDGAVVNFGELQGEPLLAEVSIEGELYLLEVDGEPV